MTVVSVKDQAKSGFSIRRITLSDGAKFSYNTAYLPSRAAEPAAGVEISPETAALFRYAANCYLAERAALRFIARAEQTRAGLVRKLRLKGADPAHVEDALDYLEKQGLLSDRRYAELWLRMKLRPALGGRRTVMSPRKLSLGLARRGVQPRMIREVLAEALGPENERALLEAYLSSVFPGLSPLPWQDGFFKRRLRAEGFSSGLIRAFSEASGEGR